MTGMEEIIGRDQRTIKNRRLSDITMDTSQAEFCRDCENDRKPIAFKISQFPVMFFRFSDLGVHAVTGTPVPEYGKSRVEKTQSGSINRLVQVFIFGLCLLTIVRVPTAMSAPTSCRDDSVPKWKNPCGQELHDLEYSGGVSSGENDRDIIGPILTAARIAQDYMQNFRENYTKETFHVPYDVQLSLYRESSHGWLPNREVEVPKFVGEKADPARLNIKLEEFLQSIYQSMQKYAVGIEQVVWDQQKTNGHFRCQFNETELHLRKVLCEIRAAIYNKNGVPLNTVERCIMDDQTRKMTETAHRNLRDWIIFKECLNGLEYLIQVLEYVEANLPS